VTKIVAHVVGARPNYMKMAPVYAALAQRGLVDQYLVHTGQHYDAQLNDVFFAELPLPEPDVMLEVGSGSHAEQTARALVGLERTFLELKPDLVVVPGDVNSTLAGALAAVKLQIPVCHLEAGLRSFDWDMPEEHNRKVADHLASLLLTPSQDAVRNLAIEGIAGAHVVLIGNTMIDSLFANLASAQRLAAWRDYELARGRYVLVTLHRPALVDSAELLARTISALGLVARTFPVVFPMHPRTRAKMEEAGIEVPERVHITQPLSYTAFLSLEVGAGAVVTDSGGVQEETTALGVPCFTLRDNTERPVTVTDGTNVVLGLDPERLIEVPHRLRGPRIALRPPLWDGAAGKRAAVEIERSLGVELARTA
jgi:UDP-N-acetylglucosamine 2-epimerase (non-hydrolysing)